MSWTWPTSRRLVVPQLAPRDLVEAYAARGVEIADLTGRLAAANNTILALETELVCDLDERVKRRLAARKVTP